MRQLGIQITMEDYDLRLDALLRDDLMLIAEAEAERGRRHQGAPQQ